MPEAEELPVSGGKPASLRNVSRVLMTQNVSAPYHAEIFSEDKHLMIVICSQITSYDYSRGIKIRHLEADCPRRDNAENVAKGGCISNCHETNGTGGAPMATAG